MFHVEHLSQGETLSPPNNPHWLINMRCTLEPYADR